MEGAHPCGRSGASARRSALVRAWRQGSHRPATAASLAGVSGTLCYRGPLGAMELSGGPWRGGGGRPLAARSRHGVPRRPPDLPVRAPLRPTRSTLIHTHVPGWGGPLRYDLPAASRRARAAWACRIQAGRTGSAWNPTSNTPLVMLTVAPPEFTAVNANVPLIAVPRS